MDTQHSLTLDIDWAPDWMVADAADRLAGAGVRATWFATHASPVLQDLRSDNVAASIFITDPQQGHRVSETLLQDSYGMTPREIEICQAFVNNPAVEMLAPQLGTAHGQYKARPVLRPDRVRELAALTDTPIVLHGGTGLTAEDFRSFIDAGVSKINISTAVKMAYMKAAAAHLDVAREQDKWDPPTMFREIQGSVQDVIATHIEWFGASGRAAGALAAGVAARTPESREAR